MSIEESLIQRSGGQCELCSSTEDLAVFEVNSPEGKSEGSCAYLCGVCRSQIENPDTIDPNHWRCLSASMWSEYAPVKVLAFHMLKTLKVEGWALELLDQIYLEDETQAWADAFHSERAQGDDTEFALDSNGTKLFAGDSVTLIKDLDVKGANFTAKRGTLVKGISLTGDPANIEGKINGTQIVLKTMFLKKAN